MTTIWYKQAYVQGFRYKYILFKITVNMFECMEIAEFIYKVLLEPSYKKTHPGICQPCWSQQE